MHASTTSGTKHWRPVGRQMHDERFLQHVARSIGRPLAAKRIMYCFLQYVARSISHLLAAKRMYQHAFTTCGTKYRPPVGHLKLTGAVFRSSHHEAQSWPVVQEVSVRKNGVRLREIPVNERHYVRELSLVLVLHQPDLLHTGTGSSAVDVRVRRSPCCCVNNRR